MTRSEGNGLVEEEQRCPGVGCGDRVVPILESQRTDDPQPTSVMADDLTSVVDQAASIAREQAPLPNGVHVPEGIDPVPMHVRSPAHPKPSGTSLISIRCCGL